MTLTNPLPALASPLVAVIETLRREGGVCLFDLDSTLLDNRPRQALILREFGASIEEKALASVEPSHFDGWGLDVAMRNAGLPADKARALEPAARAFWRERFFTSEYCRHDVPIRGAVEFTRAVASCAALVYLTGRHTQMERGTLASFVSGGFPIPDGAGVRLLLKPEQALHDDAWKEQACAIVAALGTIRAAFDNEPAHINRYRERFPEALCVHLDTDHSGRPIPLAAGIPSIPSFALP
ncbi:MAG: HAD family hydrolase [Deltaproteobacteria bacterium]